MNYVFTKGFTLIELLITLAVLAIVISLASPDFSRFIQDSRLTAKYNNNSRALLMARSEAVKRSGKVVVCPKNAMGTACANDWSRGWLVFIDVPPMSTNASNVTASMGTEDTLLQQQTYTLDGTNITAYGSTSGQSAAALKWIAYNTDGSAQVDTASILLCDGRDETSALVINVSITGDVRQGRKSATDDIPLDAFSQSIDCG